MREAQENKVYKIVQCVDKLDMPMIGDMFDYCCYVSNVNWQRVQVIDWPWFWRKKYVWCVTFTLKQETERLRVVIQKKSEHIVSPTEHGTYDAVVERDSEERQSWR